MSTVCLLADWEAESLRHGQQPDHKQHRHISRIEALAMTGDGDPRFCPYSRPVAFWVGPRAITLKTNLQWKVIRRSRFPQMALVEK